MKQEVLDLTAPLPTILQIDEVLHPLRYLLLVLQTESRAHLFEDDVVSRPAECESKALFANVERMPFGNTRSHSSAHFHAVSA